LPVPFSPVNQDVGLRRPDARDQLEHRPHRHRLGDQHRTDVGLEPLVLGFEPLLAPERPRQLDLRANDGEQPRVFPRLLHEVARASPHRLDGDVDAAPGGHDDDGEGRVVGADVRQQVEAFAARRRVARVVQIHQHGVEVVALDRLHDRRGRPTDSMR
jgi:hypothetical protein